VATFVHVQGQNPLKTHSAASDRGLHSKSSAYFIPTRANTTQLRYLRHPSCGFFTHITSFRNRPFWEKNELFKTSDDGAKWNHCPISSLLDSSSNILSQKNPHPQLLRSAQQHANPLSAPNTCKTQDSAVHNPLNRQTIDQKHP
jgi:hypothetical protein